MHDLKNKKWGGNNMKLTKSQLKEMIREELLNEDDYATQYADMIDEIRERVMFKSTNIIMILNKQDKITGTKNAKAYNKLIDTHFRKFIIGAKKIQKMIKD